MRQAGFGVFGSIRAADLQPCGGQSESQGALEGMFAPEEKKAGPWLSVSVVDHGGLML